MPLNERVGKILQYHMSCSVGTRFKRTWHRYKNSQNEQSRAWASNLPGKVLEFFRGVTGGVMTYSSSGLQHPPQQPLRHSHVANSELKFTSLQVWHKFGFSLSMSSLKLLSSCSTLWPRCNDGLKRRPSRSFKRRKCTMAKYAVPKTGVSTER